VAEFVANVSQPMRVPDDMRPGTADMCRWRCGRGHEWTTTVASRVAGAGCARCGSGGQSRFEFEVAELLQSATGLRVSVDVVIAVVGHRAQRVDLGIDDLGLLIDLDPARWHFDVDRDARKSALLVGYDFVRVRAVGLDRIDGNVVEVDGQDPWEWARVLAGKLRSRGATWQDVDVAERGRALSRAAQAWTLRTGSEPATSAVDVAPLLEGELVENLTRPGVGLSWLPPSAKDRCGWRCSSCGHEWEASVGSRA
jgi:hypothetical protein